MQNDKVYDFEADNICFSNNADLLFSKNYGKVVVIQSEKIINTFNSMKEGYDYGKKEFGVGNFTLKEIVPSSIAPILFFTPFMVN